MRLVECEGRARLVWFLPHGAEYLYEPDELAEHVELTPVIERADGVVYDVTPFSDASCGGTNFQVTVTVYPLQSLSIQVQGTNAVLEWCASQTNPPIYLASREDLGTTNMVSNAVSVVGINSFTSSIVPPPTNLFYFLTTNAPPP